jgi:hypothetical protein
VNCSGIVSNDAAKIFAPLVILSLWVMFGLFY